VPRVRNDNSSASDESLNPTFFTGISKFSSPGEYSKYLTEISGDKDKVYEMFASQVFALGKINYYKNRALKHSILFFVAAIVSELLIITSMAWSRALPFLFPVG